MATKKASRKAGLSAEGYDKEIYVSSWGRNSQTYMDKDYLQDFLDHEAEDGDTVATYQLVKVQKVKAQNAVLV